MVVSGWIILNFYTALLLILLLIFQSKTIHTRSGGSFVHLVVMTLFLVISETIGHIGELYPEKFFIYMKFGYYIIYALDPADYLFAILYINCWLDESKTVLKRPFLILYRSFMGINFLLITISVLFNFKWFYYFDGLSYMRGPFFVLRGILILILCFSLFVYVILNRNNIYPEYIRPIFALPSLALIGAFLQIFFTELNTTYASISIGLLVLFFYLQAKNLDLDYLTGSLNRRGLDIKMEEHIKAAIANKQKFAAIMFDMDHFKKINDNYGHQEGDNALKALTTILYTVFYKNSYVGRFGGDEFCVITDIGDQDKLKEKLDMVDDEIDKWNYKNEKPYKMQVSLGSMIYDPTNPMTIKDFQIAIDERMYINKREHHLADNRR